jgi:signal transduction histidine kinase
LARFAKLFEFLFADEIVSLPEGSQITIQARALPDTAEVEIEVADNGRGLPEDSLRSVFDPFFIRTGDPKEFGLNLMACYFITYHHSGKIKVHSQPGQGTTFHLTLPTNPLAKPAVELDKNYLSRVLMNDTLWEKLLSGV